MDIIVSVYWFEGVGNLALGFALAAWAVMMFVYLVMVFARLLEFIGSFIPG